MSRQRKRNERRQAEYKKLRSPHGDAMFDSEGQFWPRSERRATARALAVKAQ